MVLEEIPAPATLILGAYILGAGYFAFLSAAGENTMSEISTFDKFMVSLVFGTLSFVLILTVFNLKPDLESLEGVFSFSKIATFLFVLQIAIARILMNFWQYLQNEVFTQDFMNFN